MSDPKLRSKLIRLASENPELRSHLLPLLREKEAGAFSLHSKAMDAVRQGMKSIRAKLEAVQDQAVRKMTRQGFTFLERESDYLYLMDGGSDGWMVEGDLVFEDDKGRSDREVREIFDKEIDAYPSKRGHKWAVYLGKSWGRGIRTPTSE